MKGKDRVKELLEKVKMQTFKPLICIERAYYVTKSFMETEGEPMIIRRAKALEKVLKNITVCIEDGELIVGRAASKRFGGMLFPESGWELLEEGVSSGSILGHYVETEEEKVKLQEILSYWKSKLFPERWIHTMPEEYQCFFHLLRASAGGGGSLAHNCPGFERVLTKGLNGLKKQVNEEIVKLDLTQPDAIQKYLFLKAVNITFDAVISFAKRYAQLARSLAEKEIDGQRRLELEKIAGICEWVPANPARSFQEALQSLWFVYLAVELEGGGAGIGFGRIDQHLYPFYKKDLDEGRLTKEQALELIAMFLIKMNEFTIPFSNEMVTPIGGERLTENFSPRSGANQPLSVITLGGLTRDGKDATNELSYLFLEVEKDVMLWEEIAVRVHANTPEDFLIKALEVAKLAKGKIKFVCDETVVKQLIKDGKTVEDARDYAITGCFIHTVPGRSFDPPLGGFVNLPLALELALNNGVFRRTGEQLGPKTGDSKHFKSYHEVWNAYKKQVEFLIRQYVIIANVNLSRLTEVSLCPLQSALYDGCIERGKDILMGGTIYNTGSLWVTGIPNVGDSLAAIKKIVFEEKKITMATLIDALDKNFEGYEDVYHLLRNAPKFGNDDDYADSIVNEVLVHLCDEVGKYVTIGGRKFTISAANVAANIPLGKLIGATPEGRRAREPFSDGGLSPYYGRNVNGVTSTLRSVAKLDLWKASGGCVLNVKFNPEDVKEEFKIESKIRKLASLIKTFAKMGGDIIQFNLVSGETLRDAQKHPEKYRDLLVRVATYSAYFVDLPKEVQDDIIRRTELSGSY